MFTGIVEAVGRIAERTDSGIAVAAPEGFFGRRPAAAGESIAVNGTCLTLLDTGEVLRFDLSPETFAKTSLGDLGVGEPVNLERAMAAGDPFGGHIMQGHVDGVGRVQSVTTRENTAVYRFEVPPEFARYLIEKGSVAVDGVSLTVVNLQGTAFEAWVIPHTLLNTNLSHRRPGDRVNLEFDVLAKYVERLLAARLG